jgi:phage-related minor tail protein
MLALIIGVVLNHFGQLNDNMKQALIAIVAIFTTGNIMEHLADALKVFKGTPLEKVVDQLEAAAGVPASSQAAQAPAASGDPRVDAVIQALNELKGQIQVQAQNTNQIVQIINAMRGGPSAVPAQPAR